MLLSYVAMAVPNESAWTLDPELFHLGQWLRVIRFTVWCDQFLGSSCCKPQWHVYFQVQRPLDKLVHMYTVALIQQMFAGLVHRGSDLRSAFHAWILSTGSALVSDQEKDSALIETLLKLKIALHDMLDGPFRQDASFTDVRSPA